ncbi:hypothetical protein [Rapidithrix thailandica]
MAAVAAAAAANDLLLARKWKYSATSILEKIKKNTRLEVEYSADKRQ